MSTDNIKRAATIGCGRMGAFHSPNVEKFAPAFWMPISHLGAIAALPGLSPVACCDVNADATAKAQALHGVARTYDDYTAMLNAEQPDIVTIATRTPEKRPILDAALAQGSRNFHVEKPLVNTVADLRALEASFAATGAHMTYGAIRRFLPPYRQAAAMLARDPDMRPLHITVEMGRSPLMWTLIHGIDLILYFAGSARPVAVQGWFDTVELAQGQAHHVLNDPVLLDASILFDDGTIGHIGGVGGDGVTLSGGSRRIEILGDGHEMYDVAPAEGSPYPKRSAVAIDAQSGPGGTAAALARLAQAMDGDACAATDVARATQDIFTGQWIMFALLASHLSGGQRTALADVPDDMRIDGISYGAPA